MNKLFNIENIKNFKKLLLILINLFDIRFVYYNNDI